MAILTEKEATLEWGLFTAKLYAEFNDGQIDGLWVNLYIDGMPVRWHMCSDNQVQLIENGLISKNW